MLNKLFFSPFSLYLSFPDEVEHACSFILILQCFSPFSLGSLRLFSKFPLLPALLLGNPLYDLLLLTSCHMTSGWLRGKSWKVWLHAVNQITSEIISEIKWSLEFYFIFIFQFFSFYESSYDLSWPTGGDLTLRGWDILDWKNFCKKQIQTSKTSVSN